MLCRKHWKAVKSLRQLTREMRRGEESTTQARASILDNSKKTTCPGLTSLLNSRFTSVCFIYKSRTLPSVALSVATTSNCSRQNLPDYVSSTNKTPSYRHKNTLYNTLQLSEIKNSFRSSGESTNHKIQLAKNITHAST